MDLDDIRKILSSSRVSVWALIDAAITAACLDHGDMLKDRRDGIVERLYSQCNNCSLNHQHQQQNTSPEALLSIRRRDDENEDEDEEEERDPYGGLFDDEQTKILRIKEQLEDTNQPEDSLLELLQSLADMDLTFKVLKETDIGRNVNRFRKHSSNEIRKLVKQLVSKWKDLVDEWVWLNQPELAPSTLIADGDSPVQQNVPKNHPKNLPNGNSQVPDIASSPNHRSERNDLEPEKKPKPVPKRDAPSRPPQSSPPLASAHASASALPPNRAQKEPSIDLDKLASARRRLHENYLEAENAKKQRTIQVMGIHEIPKPKNGFIAKNKGGLQGKYHR